jgi:hypothetical protein
LRGSYDREKGLKNLHLVTAWASEQRLVLWQVKVEDRSNEITVILALLELIDMTGAIITIDAIILLRVQVLICATCKKLAQFLPFP